MSIPRQFKLLQQSFFFGFLAVVTLVFFWLIRHLLVSVFWSVALGIICYPLQTFWLKITRQRAGLSATLSLLTILLLIGMIIIPLVEEIIAQSKQATMYFAQIGRIDRQGVLENIKTVVVSTGDWFGLEVAEDLQAAQRTALRVRAGHTLGVLGLLQPGDAAAKALAAGMDLDRAAAGVVDPDAGDTGVRALRRPRRSECQKTQQHDRPRDRRGSCSSEKNEVTHRLNPSLRQGCTFDSAKCNRYAEKMRQPVTRRNAGDFMRDIKHEGISRTRSFTFLAAKPQDEHKYLYNGYGLVHRGAAPFSWTVQIAQASFPRYHTGVSPHRCSASQ